VTEYSHFYMLAPLHVEICRSHKTPLVTFVDSEKSLSRPYREGLVERVLLIVRRVCLGHIERN